MGSIDGLGCIDYRIYMKRSVTKLTKVFWSGNSQAVRIPREFLIESDEVEIGKRGDTIVLRPRKRSWGQLWESLEQFSGDFMSEARKQRPAQKRSKLFR